MIDGEDGILTSVGTVGNLSLAMFTLSILNYMFIKKLF